MNLIERSGLKQRLGSRLAIPLSPVRAISGLLLTGLTVVAGWSLVGFAILGVVGWFLRQTLQDGGFLASAGGGSFALFLALAGLLGGAALGTVLAANHLLGNLELDLAGWLESLSPEEGARLLPSVETSRLRTDYEEVLERMTEATVGRLPMPGVVRRFVKRRFREHFVEDFLADCEDMDLRTIGFSEVRNWIVIRGLPYATDPVHAQLKVWRYGVVGGFGVLLGLAGAVAIWADGSVGGSAGGLGGTPPGVDPATVIVGLSLLVGLGLLARGLPGSADFERPWVRRVGIVALAGCLMFWPLAWLQLLRLDLGLVWLVVLALTVVTFQWSVRMAFVRARKPRFLR